MLLEVCQLAAMGEPTRGFRENKERGEIIPMDVLYPIVQQIHALSF